ncbi:MAG: thioredoxin family protein [Phycisphaerae bacterium]|nr:thioredoxin family protein [Phycisphaerae bacterium]
MTLVNSTMLELGTLAPQFELTDEVSGQAITPDAAAKAKGLLVMFICKHCPYVKHVQDELARIGNDYAEKDIGIVAISSNDAQAYPEDSPANLQAMARDLGFTFPVCHDETQQVAKAYTAACTPDFFLFDADMKLVYRGQLDDSRPGNDKPLTGKDLRAALDAVLAGKPVAAEQRPSAGCNIKWKPGKEPPYFTG